MRVTALQATRNREPTTALAAAVSQRLLGDDNARVRMQALRIAILWQRAQPELHDVLAEVAKREAEDAIQRLAAAELGPK